MPDDSQLRAPRVSREELTVLLHDASEERLLALLEDPAFDESHVVLLLERLDLPVSVLAAIGEKGKWTASEAVRVRLVRHPRTPRRTAISLLRQLYLFDLVRVSLLPSTPMEIRRMAEELIITRIPHVPVGEKLTLARRGSARVAGAVLAEGHAEALKLALANSFLTESQLLKVLNKPGVPPRVVAAIAQHPKWSLLYNIRVALIRNSHTPAPLLPVFLPHILLRDLKDLATLPTLALPVRKYIRKELERRASR
jgi:hypothetical protein